MKAPIVQKFMTRLPVEMERVENVSNARQLMELFNIHHVPVMRGLKLVGVVSERDIWRAELRHGNNIGDFPIEKIARTDVLTVNPLTPVDQVAEKMLDRGVDSVMVVDGEYVVGIFTSTDALKMLASWFGKSAKTED